MTVLIANEQGVPLARVLLEDAAGGPSVVIKRVVSGKGHLLNHYFCRGMRNVTVETDLFRLPGVLQTNWLGRERQWSIRLNPITSNFAPNHSAARPPAAQSKD